MLADDGAEVDLADEPEQLSLFSVLSAVATGMKIHSVTADGVAYDDEPEIDVAGQLDDWTGTLTALPGTAGTGVNQTVAPTAAGAGRTLLYVLTA